jgi:hypothetical protein
MIIILYYNFCAPTKTFIIIIFYNIVIFIIHLVTYFICLLLFCSFVTVPHRQIVFIIFYTQPIHGPIFIIIKFYWYHKSVIRCYTYWIVIDFIQRTSKSTKRLRHSLKHLSNCATCTGKYKYSLRKCLLYRTQHLKRCLDHASIRQTCLTASRTFSGGLSLNEPRFSHPLKINFYNRITVCRASGMIRVWKV